MAATIIYGESVREEAEAAVEGARLWLPAETLHAATGWELKPEGLCRDEMCIPVPPGREPEFVRQDAGRTYVDFRAFADYIGQPYASDESGSIWAFGESPEELRSQILSLEAPDFTLPGYDGREYTLSAFRGRKVLLLLWSSW